MNAYRALRLISMALTLGVQGVEIAHKITDAGLDSDDPNAHLDAAAKLADDADAALAQAIRAARQ